MWQFVADIYSNVIQHLINRRMRRCFLLVANHFNHIATSRHAQLWEEVADKLYVAIVYPIENHGVHIVDNHVSFYHI